MYIQTGKWGSKQFRIPILHASSIRSRLKGKLVALTTLSTERDPQSTTPLKLIFEHDCQKAALQTKIDCMTF